MFNESKMDNSSEQIKYLLDFKTRTTVDEMTVGLPGKSFLLNFNSFFGN